jgi:hypothetical protein
MLRADDSQSARLEVKSYIIQYSTQNKQQSGNSGGNESKKNPCQSSKKAKRRKLASQLSTSAGTATTRDFF